MDVIGSLVVGVVYDFNNLFLVVFMYVMFVFDEFLFGDLFCVDVDEICKVGECASELIW